MDEVEIRILLPELPPEISLGILNGQYNHEEIEQFYISGSLARIRKSTDSKGETLYTKTFKEDIPDKQGIVRKEKIEEITQEEYESLFDQRVGILIQKTRHYVPIEDVTLEVNMFHGDLEGRVLGEIEFESYKQALAFKKPDWIGRDVTRELSNRSLAMGAILPRE